MTTTTRSGARRTSNVALILAASAFASAAVLAADPQPEAQVTIRAERPNVKVVGRTSSGVPIEEYQLSYRVTFGDLDIATPVGAQALKARVRTAAISLCKDLDQLYPVADHDTSCATKAEEGAMSQVNTAITTATAQVKGKTR
jgi:UrcA family protein